MPLIIYNKRNYIEERNTSMKLFSDSCRMVAALILGTCLLWSCQKGDPASGSLVKIDMRIGADNVIGVRAFSDDDPLSVDRILIMPFTKRDGLAENNANYMAAPELAVQLDVDNFPVENLKIFLSPMSTCKLVVLGFNRQNYDHYNRDPQTDDIVIDYAGSLYDLNIEDMMTGNLSPQNAELFYDMSESFRPGSGTSVSATLVRMVGGISVTLTSVPDGVEMRLYHTSSFASRWKPIDRKAADSYTQTGYYQMTTAGGVSSYSRFYFPTNGTPITMEIEAVDIATGEQIARVRVATSGSSEFNLAANQAINLSGDYRSVILGQQLFVANPADTGINIDDDNWDGVDDTPAADPDGTPDPTVDPNNTGS